MGSIFIIQGILIYIYAFDHNPPHIHVRSGTDNFSITIQDRIIEGKARSKTVKIINDFIDEHEEAFSTSQSVIRSGMPSSEQESNSCAMLFSLCQ